MRRLGVLLVLLGLLTAACGDSARTNAEPSRSAFSRPTYSYSPTPSPSPSALYNACFMANLSRGVRLDQIASTCRFQAFLAEVRASIAFRNSIVTGFNAVRPNRLFFANAAHLIDWEKAACRQRGSAVQTLVMRFDPTPLERILLLSPLLDFAVDTATWCPSDPTIKDDLAAAAWSAVAGSRPTVTRARFVLQSQIRPPSIMSELFAEVRGPCDIVGNASVIAWKRWVDDTPPKLLELALGTFVGFACDHVLE